MKKWDVWGTVTGTKYIGTVEANSRKGAEEKAYQHDNIDVMLCHKCSRECETPEIHDVYVEESDQ